MLSCLNVCIHLNCGLIRYNIYETYLKVLLSIMYTMSGSALNIPSGREIRQNLREQRKNTVQQKMDREIRLNRRNEMMVTASSEVANEINSMTRRTMTTRTGRKATSYF